MEPLLQWLHVGGRGYIHTCIPKGNEHQMHLDNNISSASFADDRLHNTYLDEVDVTPRFT
jgi:hypothetical protein